MMEQDLLALIAEYSDDYCTSLELVYGDGLMSEGGHEAIEAMFAGMGLKNKSLLDVGAGLGGVALYLAEQHNCKVTGLEINPEMVIKANRRIPHKLQDRVSYTCYDNTHCLPFIDQAFDIIYSKGVLTHVKNKTPLFLEFKRVLTSQGKLIINDWLSPTDDYWGDNVRRLIEIEGLTLHALSPNSYMQLLTDLGFTVSVENNVTSTYADYNKQIVKDLRNNTLAERFKQKMGEQLWLDYIESYDAIAKAMTKEELLVYHFIAK